jgi:hypothetical protein
MRLHLKSESSPHLQATNADRQGDRSLVGFFRQSVELVFSFESKTIAADLATCSEFKDLLLGTVRQSRTRLACLPMTLQPRRPRWPRMHGLSDLYENAQRTTLCMALAVAENLDEFGDQSLDRCVCSPSTFCKLRADTDGVLFKRCRISLGIHRGRRNLCALHGAPPSCRTSRDLAIVSVQLRRTQFSPIRYHFMQREHVSFHRP